MSLIGRGQIQEDSAQILLELVFLAGGRVLLLRSAADCDVARCASHPIAKTLVCSRGRAITPDRYGTRRSGMIDDGCLGLM